MTILEKKVVVASILILIIWLLFFVGIFLLTGLGFILSGILSAIVTIVSASYMLMNQRMENSGYLYGTVKNLREPYDVSGKFGCRSCIVVGPDGDETRVLVCNDSLSVRGHYIVNEAIGFGENVTVLVGGVKPTFSGEELQIVRAIIFRKVW